MAQQGSISGSFDADRLAAFNRAADALRASLNVRDAESRIAYQQAMRPLGSLAIPPTGHLCAGCNQPGDLYCYYVAVERVRGIRAAS